ncbi:MAG TPA: cation-translocating P-type ATPase [Anaerolineaceae bacterium]|nr:cation-translocating P-type ATPase [Anaerolineaceae bacterium]HPN51518.1 cation-translocating P-type ATPase [Anaerolineaceae bacterium]
MNAIEEKQKAPGIWHAMEAEAALKALDVNAHSGLTDAEVARRKEIHGSNELLEAPRPGFLQLVYNQLKSFVIILLIVASIISALLGDWVEAGAILAIVVLNAVLGVVQEQRAEQALAALKKMAAPEAQVLRDGHRKSIPASSLVPGDVVFLEAGNFIPADLRLLEAVNLRVEEAALTGESMPIQKNANAILAEDATIGDRKNMVFMGTVVAYGRGRGLVVDTGMKTQLGQIATMLQEVEQEETPLQRRLDQLGKVLGWGALAVCGLVFLVSIVRLVMSGGFDITSTSSQSALVETFMVAVSLAIAAVPEGLPAIVTISLALGMREMVRRHALIRRLSSVETLGSATVICSDKTGTLTQNEMTVTQVWVDNTFVNVTGTGYNPRGEFQVDGKTVHLAKDLPGVLTALWVGILNNDAELEAPREEGGAYRIIGDPTEGALVVAAVKAGAEAESLNSAYPRTKEIPFDSVRKRMITIHALEDPRSEDISPFHETNKGTGYVVAVKGAPDMVMNLCTHYQALNDKEAIVLDEAARAKISAANDAMSSQALRVLGVAFKVIHHLPEELSHEDLEQDLIFAGLLGMIDPPRLEVKPALETARGAGIRTVMITGDYPKTAAAIAGSIGLLQSGHKVLSGADLDELSDEAMKTEVMVTDVFARVSPEHKMRIVDALRANDQVVAMTGDGVNDAPAIKRADIGVAMGITGTDVAKGAADMVLTDDNYASIVSAVEQGRIIYSNIRKFVYFLVSCNTAEIAIIFLATLISGTSPLTPIQLLWLNLVTDGAPALALGTEKGDPDTMRQKPRPAKESIINRFMAVGIVVQTITKTFATLAAYYWGLQQFPDNILYAETMAFVTLSFAEILRAYTARSEYTLVHKMGIFKNKVMNWAVLSSLVLVLAVVYIGPLQGIFDTVSLGWQQWVEIIPLFFIPYVAAELTKFFYGLGHKPGQD